MPVSASKTSSSLHIKLRLYITESAKQGKYGSLNDVFVNESDFVFNIEDEDDDNKGRQNESILKNASTGTFSSSHLSSDSVISHYVSPFSLFVSPIYIAQRVLRI